VASMWLVGGYYEDEQTKRLTISCASKRVMSEAPSVLFVIRNPYVQPTSESPQKNAGKTVHTLVTPLNTTLKLVPMITPTRPRLICLASDATSSASTCTGEM
jgi:hypothetical protein